MSGATSSIRAPTACSAAILPAATGPPPTTTTRRPSSLRKTGNSTLRGDRLWGDHPLEVGQLPADRHRLLDAVRHHLRRLVAVAGDTDDDRFVPLDRPALNQLPCG